MNRSRLVDPKGGNEIWSNYLTTVNSKQILPKMSDGVFVEKDKSRRRVVGRVRYGVWRCVRGRKGGTRGEGAGDMGALGRR